VPLSPVALARINSSSLWRSVDGASRQFIRPEVLPAIQSRTLAGGPKPKQKKKNNVSKPKNQSSARNIKKKFKPATPKPTKLPKAKIHPTHEKKRFLPPALLLPTASPFAYVASVAAMEAETDPKTIFADIAMQEGTAEPFSGMTFEYFPPKSFDHKLLDGRGSTKNQRIIPEVAFLGRSNVGKSSLINAIMGRELARCSKHPGRTQQPYYYGLLPVHKKNNRTTDSSSSSSSVSLDPLSSHGFLVDLPGYGFAHAPDKTVEDWQQQTQDFLKHRRDAGTLHRLFLLIDARRGLVGSTAAGKQKGSALLDQSVMRWLDRAGIPYSVVITKADCVSAPQVVKVANEACIRYHQQHQENEERRMEYEEKIDDMEIDDGDIGGLEPSGWMGPIVHVTSAKKGDGIQELRSAVEAELHTDM
jgi:ribosome biogenesis GTP-binding protein YsxC/EngB